MKVVPKKFVLDVDGVLTTGQFLYSESGKVYKVFGPHDSDGLKMLREKLGILFITADHRGFAISKKRIVDDMGYDLKLVSEDDRPAFFEKEIGYDQAIYMGDGIYDAPILKECICGIAPQNARPEAKEAADYVTPSASGCGAVLDACLYISYTYFPSE
jgi:3-deoxy-D-manno-octulosonate 8-phosphate phosphatase (KDO 8-P phosphatase)